jgi:zinc protease
MTSSTFARRRTAILAAGVLLSFSGVHAADVQIDIPYQKFVLKNGLTLLVHEDHKAPIVAVNVWYHVGSKNEKRGKTGFAHLFEHLMFNGSEHFNTDYFKVLEKLGATDLNGTTNEDRTNYFQNVPKSALDTVLWMESDRMGHLLGAIDQARLDEQRGVVQNEKRQGENQPYGLVSDVITENTWPAAHPYSWTVIGSMEDLNAASLDDVKEWFRTYYGPSNAVLVIAGDIDAKTAREKVEKYFGSIPPGPPVRRQEVWIPHMQGTHRAVLQDRVPQALLVKIWNIPQTFSRDADLLALAGHVLGSGRTSRLYKRLVYRDQIATEVSAELDQREIAGQFIVTAMVKPGADINVVEKEVDEEMAKFLAEGPDEKELKIAQTDFVSGFVRGVERIGGFGGKSDVLARGQVFAGDPDAYKKQLADYQKATTAEVRDAARRWLSDGVFILHVNPFPHYDVVSATDVDRSKPPEPGPVPDAHLPARQTATLGNGLKIIVAERHEVPVVNFRLLLDAGYAADQYALPGTAQMALNMLDEGTKDHTSLQLAELEALLGARLGGGSDLDASTVTLSALKSNLDASLDLYADVILNPSFPQSDFNRIKNETLASIEREKSEPVTMALRVFPRLMYGAGHAYGNPLTGSGTEESVSKMTREDLVKFHDTWFKPNHATLIVVGDTTLSEIRPKLEKLFAAWKPGDVPQKKIGAVAQKDHPQVYIIDQPGAIQSTIFVGNVAPPRSDPDELAIQVMNTILGGMFVSRVNMNLREDKHWTYGAGTDWAAAKGPSPFFAYAPVQTDKTKESMVELAKELRDIESSRPVTDEELAMAKDNETRQMPGAMETARSISGFLANITKFHLPENYYDTYASRVRALTKQQITAAAEKVIHPTGLIWVIVGDRGKIEGPVKSLNFGPVAYLDADGNPVK